MESKGNKKGLEVTFYGTRGSTPIANKHSVLTGGNTTCVRVDSPCLPEGWWLVIDGGSGFVPLSLDALKGGVKVVQQFFTHYHHDHTQGEPLGALTFMHHIPIHCWGPVDGGLGPREVLEHIMKHPFFPVDFSQVSAHFTCHKLEHPNTQVLLIHPEGGIKQMSVISSSGLMVSPCPSARTAGNTPRMSVWSSGCCTAIIRNAPSLIASRKVRQARSSCSSRITRTRLVCPMTSRLC